MSDTWTTICNNVPRDTIDAWQLTAAERDNFDYLDWSGIDAGTDSATFFRYRGQLYDLGEFQTTSGLPTDSPLAGWSGFQSDTFFSATVIRWADDQCETLVVGRVYS